MGTGLAGLLGAIATLVLVGIGLWIFSVEHRLSLLLRPPRPNSKAGQHLIAAAELVSGDLSDLESELDITVKRLENRIEWMRLRMRYMRATGDPDPSKQDLVAFAAAERLKDTP